MDLPPTRIIDTLKKQPLQFTPGSRYNYSNSNYYLLGYIIEIITGKTYREYLQQNIFTPLGLTNTFYDDPNLIILNRVSGYINDNGKYRNAGYLSMSLVYAAGALASNVEDLFKWHQALYSYKLVKKETLEKAFTPYKLAGGQLSEYGYGWFIKNIKGNKYIAHGGGIDGFRAMELYIPAHDIYVTTLINSENDASTNLAIEISDLVLGKSAVKEVVVHDSILNSYIGTYQYAGNDPNIKVTVTIYKKNGKLYADLSNGTGSNMVLLAQSDTRFILPDIKRITTTVDFIIENGKVVKQIWTQEAKTEFKKID
jgi:CubicO group peptidase (beta-lactamase class C family)